MNDHEHRGKVVQVLEGLVVGVRAKMGAVEVAVTNEARKARRLKTTHRLYLEAALVKSAGRENWSVLGLS